MLYDDVPNARENPLKGDVHNVPAGENLRYGVVVDCSGNEVTPDCLALLPNALARGKVEAGRGCHASRIRQAALSAQRLPGRLRAGARHGPCGSRLRTAYPPCDRSTPGSKLSSLATMYA